MNGSSPSVMLRAAVGSLVSRWRTVFAVHLLFTLLGIAVIMPVFSATLRALVAMSGSAAVADQDIAMLVFSPLGMLAAIGMIALLLAITGLEMAALQAVAHARQRHLHIGAVDAVLWAFRHIDRVFRLTFHLTVRVLVYVLPFAGVIAIVALLLLRDYDINYYLSARPPVFFVALVVGAIATLALAFFLGRRLLGWCLVLPLVLFGQISPAQSFSRSEELTHGLRQPFGWTLAAWLALALTAGLIPALFLKLATGTVLGSGLTVLHQLVGLLLLTGVLWSLLLFLVGALNFGLFAFVVEQLYATAEGPLSAPEHLPLATRETVQRRPVVLATAAALLAALALALGVTLLGGIAVQDKAVIIAHRGAAAAAPENTLVAVTKAVQDGAHWVEIDVQESRDGHIVVVHDSDFMKLAGSPLKVWNGDLEDIRALDVGSWFDTRFAGEQVPTLREVLQAVRGKSRLIIELKYYGHNERLEQRVIDAVEAMNMESDVMLMSLELSGVNSAQQLRPDWRAGLLAATAVGDLTKLDVDFLAVNQGLASPAFIKRAHSQGKQVYVWTVNDALAMSRLMSMGVDGIITDEPAMAASVLAQRAELSTTERLLLSLAVLLDRPEIALRYRDNPG